MDLSCGGLGFEGAQKEEHKEKQQEEEKGAPQAEPQAGREGSSQEDFQASRGTTGKRTPTKPGHYCPDG